METTWTLVADRRCARILASNETRGERFEEVVNFVHPASLLKAEDVVTDQPGRFESPRETSNGRHAHQSGDPENDLRHQSADRFATEIVRYLEKARQKGRFDRLVLVAAPLFLGALRDKLTASLGQMVAEEINKDYTQLTSIELGRRLLVK